MQRVRKYLGLAVIGMTCGAAMSLPGNALAGDYQGSLATCQSLKDQKEHYQNLRRKGGSGSQMNYWRKQMRELDEKMSELNCGKYRGNLN